MPPLSDAHTHSSFSFDGKDTMSALADGAARAGLSVLTVTDHYDVYSRFTPADYLAAYRAAAADGAVELLLGVELGEGHLDAAGSDALLDALPLDFVLGSCHYVEGQPDFYDIRCAELDECRRRVEGYLDELLRMIAWGRFHVLGHLTYPLRYMAGREGFPVDFSFCEDRVKAVFRALVESGKGIEVNVSGLRRGSFAMPDLPLLELFRACGGEIVTVGSDAHNAGDVGAHIPDGYALLRAAGFASVALFRQGRPDFVRI
ncbi:MAG: PHP domain-containing protein [Oscillospiraceae bacterium]|jgi:histidinol-phosphatase (PHP family)|nr:PHP domain-containing protein [Oscillospiraceae bacterium]